MPRVFLLDHTRREWFIVEQAVGSGAPNRREDVYLVQFLLRVAGEDAGGFKAIKPPNAPPITIDGFFGEETRVWIKFYQEEVNRRQNINVLNPDGRVDPPKLGHLKGSLTHTTYTAIDLNVAYRSRRGDAFPVEKDPHFPTAIKPHLFLA